MAKRFKEAADAAQPVYSTIIGSAQAEQDAQVVQDAQEALKTQGKKGMKMPRINMAFSPSNIDFVRVMAALKGQTMTQYVNALLDREREANGEAYEAAKKLSTDL
jgi:hypothetical protein|nr:MAG TPA: repressor [Caudoviricetes sp.]